MADAVETEDARERTEEVQRWAAFSGGMVLDCKNASKSWRLVHSHYTLCVVHRGRADWQYRGLHFSCDPGTVYVCEPGEVHVTKRVYVPGDYTVFFLDPDAVARAAQELEIGFTPHFAGRGVARVDLWRAFAAMQGFVEPRSSEGLEEELSRLVASLLLETQPKAAAPECSEHKLEAVRALLAERYRADPTRVVRLRPIAAEVGVSYHRLVHAFSRRFAVAPYEYVSLVRAQHALSELRRGPREHCRSLTAVAQQCGYSDSAHMSRSFRRYWGLPPRAVASGVNPAWMAREKSRRSPPSTRA